MLLRALRALSGPLRLRYSERLPLPRLHAEAIADHILYVSHERWTSRTVRMLFAVGFYDP